MCLTTTLSKKRVSHFECATCCMRTQENKKCCTQLFDAWIDNFIHICMLTQTIQLEPTWCVKQIEQQRLLSYQYQQFLQSIGMQVLCCNQHTSLERRSAEHDPHWFGLGNAKNPVFLLWKNLFGCWRKHSVSMANIAEWHIRYSRQQQMDSNNNCKLSFTKYC